jgi:hypothetical protein
MTRQRGAARTERPVIAGPRPAFIAPGSWVAWQVVDDVVIAASGEAAGAGLLRCAPATAGRLRPRRRIAGCRRLLLRLHADRYQARLDAGGVDRQPRGQPSRRADDLPGPGGRSCRSSGTRRSVSTGTARARADHRCGQGRESGDSWSRGRCRCEQPAARAQPRRAIGCRSAVPAPSTRYPSSATCRAGRDGVSPADRRTSTVRLGAKRFGRQLSRHGALGTVRGPLTLVANDHCRASSSRM